MIHYRRPSEWIRYDRATVFRSLADTKAAVMSVMAMPYQRAWVEPLQRMQLKREVAGTSKIEGADFTEGELDAALQDTAETLLTRSQRQARAALNTYRWIGKVPDDRPLDDGLICEIHRRMVTGADDECCQPGVIRRRDENVTFGVPPHRGVEGGDDCRDAFMAFSSAVSRQFRDHD